MRLPVSAVVVCMPILVGVSARAISPMTSVLANRDEMQLDLEQTMSTLDASLLIGAIQYSLGIEVKDQTQTLTLPWEKAEHGFSYKSTVRADRAQCETLHLDGVFFGGPQR